MKKFAAILFVLFIINEIQAQVGIGINSPDPSAMLHVQDTGKGLLVPRMSDLQRNAVQNPAEGLLVYQTNNSKGFWYFTNGQWKNLSASNNGGKHTLYLADDITNAEALAKIATDVGPNTQEVRIVRCTSLTSVDLSMISNLTEIYLSGNAVLQSVNFNNLQAVDGGIYIDQCPLLSSMPTSQLTKIGQSTYGNYSLQVSSTGLLNLNFPILTKAIGTIYIASNPALTSISIPQMTQHNLWAIINAFKIESNPSLNSISLAGLMKVGDLFIWNNINLASLNIAALTTAKNFALYNSQMITAVSLPVLRNATDLNFGSNSLLANLSLPLLDTVYDGTIDISGNQSLSSISFPVLTKAGAINIQSNASLTSLSFPLLKNLTLASNSAVSNCVSLTSLSFPVLTGIPRLIMQYNTALISVSLPAVTSIGACNIQSNNSLTSISFDALSNIGTLDPNINFSLNKLPSLQVNYLLHKLVTVAPALTNKTIMLSQIVAAAPTGQGIIDRSLLILNGNTVTTD